MSNAKLRMRRLVLSISIAIMVILNMALLVYPLWYFVDFIQLKIVSPYTIHTHGEKIKGIDIKPPFPIPSDVDPDDLPYKLPDPYRNHFHNVNLTLPCDSSMILFSYSANSSVDVLIFRKYDMFEAFMNLSGPSHLIFFNDTQTALFMEYPMDRSTVIISDTLFASRFFTTKLVNETDGKYPHALYQSGGNSTNVTRLECEWYENTITLYIVFRKLITQTEYLSIDYWYWLEYDDNRGFLKFNIALIFLMIILVLDTIYFLNLKSCLRLTEVSEIGKGPNFLERLDKFIALETCLCFAWCVEIKKKIKRKNHSSLTRSYSSSDNLCTTSRGANIVFKDLSYISFTGRTILYPISAEIECGKLTAVIGKSGSSKTTFVNTLCRRASHGIQLGQVLVDGQEISLETSKIIGFVPQDDVMASDLTVSETIEFSLRYRKNSEFSQNKVLRTLEKLGLLHVKDSPISRISGGERRRTSIGIEIVNDTPVLICKYYGNCTLTFIVDGT